MRRYRWRQPEAVKKGRSGRRNRLRGAHGRGTLEKQKPPIFGMIQQGGQVAIRRLANVKQTTIRPLVEATITPGTLVYTDEDNLYDRLEEWGLRTQVYLPPRWRVCLG